MGLVRRFDRLQFHALASHPFYPCFPHSKDLDLLTSIPHCFCSPKDVEELRRTGMSRPQRQSNDGAASNAVSKLLPDLDLITSRNQPIPRFSADPKSLKPLNPIEEYDGLSTITSNQAYAPMDDAHEPEPETVSRRERAAAPRLPFVATGVAGAGSRNTQNQEPPEYRTREPLTNVPAIPNSLPTPNILLQERNDSK